MRIILSSKAFTMFELILVVLVLGVVAGLSLPQFSRSYQSLQFNSALGELVYIMQLAQSQAVTLGEPVRWNFDSVRRSYYLEEKEPMEESLSQQVSFKRMQGRWGQEHFLPDFIETDSQKETILFYPDGSIEKKSIYFCRKKKEAGVEDFKDCRELTTALQRGHIQLLEGNQIQE